MRKDFNKIATIFKHKNENVIIHQIYSARKLWLRIGDLIFLIADHSENDKINLKADFANFVIANGQVYFFSISQVA